MPDQASYLFDNQYHPDVIDKVYNQVRATTWDYCMKCQGAATQQYLYGGLVTEFKQDVAFNQSMGFPEKAYTLFIPTRLLDGNQKYILTHFVRNKETFSLREMLQNPIFSDQYIFHLADYIFMNLRCRIMQNGTWLIIPVDTNDGITQKFMTDMMNGNYGGDWSENRWFLEKRPRVSYAYREATLFSLVQKGNRVYLDSFTEQKAYYKTDPINDWKICVSDRSDNMALMRATCSFLSHDEDGRAYLTLSDVYLDYIKNSTFQLHCFLYHEGDKAGYTISPNYNGPSGFLFTCFDEYIATVNKERLKVAAMGSEGDWTVSDAVDKKFPDMDTIAVGYTRDANWIAIPTRSGVSPIYPSNFRVWEYDYERDTIGRMVSFEMQAGFPNIYLYKMKTDSQMLMVEWFRDDYEIHSQYDDFTAPYRQYLGDSYYDNAIHNTLPKVIEEFKPYTCKMDVTDFVRHLLLESSHDYRVQELSDLLKETGLHYDVLYNALNEKNRRYRTHVFKMAEMPNLYQQIQEKGYLRIVSHADSLAPYDMYIDGVHIADTQCHWADFNQFITVPKEKVTGTSVIIVDIYENTFQSSARCIVEKGLAHTFVPESFPLQQMSGSDIVVTDPDGIRVPLERVRYGVYAREILAQVPFGLIEWDKLGISPDDPRIQDRVGVMEGTDFKALTFRMLIPMDISYTHLLTNLGERVSTLKDGEHIVVKSGELYLYDPVFFASYDESHTDGDGNPSSNVFNKRINARDLVVGVNGYGRNSINIYNCNLWRYSYNEHMGVDPNVTIINYMGADDPNRLIAFLNGELLNDGILSGTVPTSVPGDFTIHVDGTFDSDDRCDVIYLPFPVQRFTFEADDRGWANLAGTGIMVICDEDLLFINGRRYPVCDFQFLTNQQVKCPVSGEVTLIRLCRDSNLYGFEDTTKQSFLDVLYQQSPGFKQRVINTFR